MKSLICTLALLTSSCTTVRPNSMEEFREVTVKIMSEESGGGTGVIYKSSPKGSIILTNAHICEAIATGGKVLNGEVYTITKYKISKRHDLCYLFVKEDLKINTVIAESAPTRYTKVFITGHPHLYPHIVSEGYVSGTGFQVIAMNTRACTKEEQDKDPITCIFEGYTTGAIRLSTLVSALISPGSSGSGVFNKQGELVGLAFAARGDIGYALVVPWMYLEQFVNVESKKLAWETPGPEHKKVSYENGGMSDLNNWRKLLELLKKKNK